ncbi:class I SAM-dependent methyltransferase [Acidianus manzaensis]|uniref:Methyltransferase type 11 n=1 Tax=Acidianus manzaensis TaxID=282676 RepID=A0A1W6JZC9_9CREN|nr:class I SAM-dependent methyltransferase [Acidianus manzaensis]ARM75544.1 methyltransferase type 11 [Acidianus manzaensis]
MAKDRYINPVVLDNPLRSIFSSREKILSRFRGYLKENYIALDLGCGPGFFTIDLSKILKNGIVYAVDPDPRAINRLNEKIKKLSINNIKTFVAPAQKLNFIKDNSIDFIFSNLVLCCLVDHEGAVKEIIRVLNKEKGIAYISVTKGLFGKDERDVSQEEWKNILSKFNVIKQGNSIMERWAIISLV